MIFGLNMNKEVNKSHSFDNQILELIPHRPPMLLINQLIAVNSRESSALVVIDAEAPFYQKDLGVPSWIGLEYMGQTAALMAGFQVREGLIDSHLGFLLGSRSYQVETEYFQVGSELVVNCVEVALVGESLATFDCTIHDNKTNDELVRANLSVFRKPPITQ